MLWHTLASVSIAQLLLADFLQSFYKWSLVGEVGVVKGAGVIVRCTFYCVSCHLPMKNDRRIVACQHAGSSPTTDRLQTRPTRPPSAPVSLSTATSDMGLQPLTHAASRLPHLMPCPSPDNNCHCVVKPQERTILHGILTGQGHKFGYGDKLCINSLCNDTQEYNPSDNRICLDLHLHTLDNHTLGLSREVILPSRYTTPPLDK